MDVECVLTGPDGNRIPGALIRTDDDTCPVTVDVLEDPTGLVDPVLDEGGVDGAALGDAVLLGIGLGLCVPATRRVRPRFA